MMNFLPICVLMITSAIFCNAFDDLFTAGNKAFSQKKFDEAIDYYKRASAMQSPPQLYFNLGMSYFESHNFHEALEAFNEALKRNPNYVRALLSIGQTYEKLHQPDNALTFYQKTLALDENNFDAQRNSARIYFEKNNVEQSLYHSEKAVALRPHDAQVLLEYANTLNTYGKCEQALKAYFTILDLAPNQPSILYNIGYTLKKQGHIQAALPFYLASLEKSPQAHETHFGLGLLYLSMGDFERGWKEYEWRLKRDTYTQQKFSKPLWDGSSPKGKTLLIHAEQGLGDTFQFIRYAQFLKEQGAKIIVAVQSPLVTLLSLCPYLDTVIKLNDPVPPYDMHAAMVSLPFLCNTVETTIPSTIPYLYADQSRVDYWHKKLSADKNFKIGICWQGNPNYQTHFLRVTVAAKSMKALDFVPLAALPGISLYSLQRESGTDTIATDAACLNLHVFDTSFDNEHGRFMDTAAVIKNLDLIITIDTSIAHIAGGLGAPVWLLVPNPPDWRWMLEREDTPWYPNMKLFRQPKPGDWQSVMERVVGELSFYMHARKS